MPGLRIIEVLVIEDYEIFSTLYSHLLENIPNVRFKLTVRKRLNEGIKSLHKGNYDVLLLDLNLPDSDNLQTIKIIPNISNLIPIVVMTSTEDELLALQTMNMGGEDYLNKSTLNRTLLVRSVLYAIERHQLKMQLQLEKKKSDHLLRNILPHAIAEELMTTGFVEARQYEKVSVMFVDFVNFTQINTTLDPNDLVKELHICFSQFDLITQRLGLEKIKTIGDAYMCAGGIPDENETHVEDMLKAAFEIMDFIAPVHKKLESGGKAHWPVRIGIHVGPAIAGVVGTRKFTYDIWGDTVNIAARMESNGEPGRVNISEAVYQELKYLPNYTFHNRGEIEVKGKGALDMYFIKNDGTPRKIAEVISSKLS
jgi:class 3 adenylate cyclase